MFQVQWNLGKLIVMQLIEKFKTSTSKRKPYTKYSADERFKVGKYASENGPVAAVRKFENPRNI